MTSITGALHLNIQDGKVMLQRCALYAHAVPVLNNHHVCPESWWVAAGRPVGSPMIYLCPDCHMATHCAIDGLIRKLDTSALPPRCVALAQHGLLIAKQEGLTPRPTL